MNHDEGTARFKLLRRDGTFSWAIIDTADLPLVLPYRWYEARRSNTVYVATSVGSGPTRRNMMLHRLLTDAPKGLHVDHKDGDGRNNRRSNIRVATAQQNRRNEVRRREHTSAYRGASWCKSTEKWVARCNMGTKHLYLGVYDTEIEAALAYDAAARLHFGEFASTNFTVEEAAAMPKPKRRPRRDRNNLPHGRGRYTNYGCRCDVCRAAESTYQRARRDRDKAAA